MIGSYPLLWPVTQERTPDYRKKFSKFKAVSQDVAQRGIQHQLKLLQATDVVLSSNIKLRQDGLPYASQAAPADAGIAVYFNYNGARHCMAVDHYVRVWENMRAIELSIEAIRGIERWGGAKIMAAAVSGFKELPSAIITEPPKAWYDVLGVSEHESAVGIKAAWKRLVARYHPDNQITGDVAKFHEVQEAYKKFEGNK
jgi:hypothetical protein